MNWSKWIRQIHRWLAIVFTVTVIANFVAMTQGRPSAWVTYSPLLPLFVLMFTGLYMFVLPMPPSGGAGHRSKLRIEPWQPGQRGNASAGAAPPVSLFR